MEADARNAVDGKKTNDDAIVYGDGAVFHRGMQCFVKHAMFDFELHSLTIILPHGSSTDMHGAIAYAQRLDPVVESVMILQCKDDRNCSAFPDIEYRRIDGKWTAISYRGH